MKKLILMFFAVVALSSCAEKYAGEFEELHDEIADLNEALDEMCNQVNDNIVSLKKIVEAVEDYDYITAIEKV